MDTKTQQRFFAKVNKQGGLPTIEGWGHGECWLWTAGKFSRGYGNFYLNGRDRYAHIVSYELANGKVPDGLELDHICRRPSCIRPEHLEAVTHKENTLRGEGPSAKNARKTLCQQGHELAASVWEVGTRHCPTCHRERARQRYARERAALVNSPDDWNIWQSEAA